MENICEKINHNDKKYKLVTVCDKSGNIKTDEESERRMVMTGKPFFIDSTSGCYLIFATISEEDKGFITSQVMSVELDEKQLIVHTLNSGYYFEEVE